MRDNVATQRRLAAHALRGFFMRNAVFGYGQTARRQHRRRNFRAAATLPSTRAIGPYNQTNRRRAYNENVRLAGISRILLLGHCCSALWCCVNVRKKDVVVAAVSPSTLPIPCLAPSCTSRLTHCLLGFLCLCCACRLLPYLYRAAACLPHAASASTLPHTPPARLDRQQLSG